MLIGTTVIGLERMMRIIRLAQKKRREDEHNTNIYESFTYGDDIQAALEEEHEKLVTVQKFEESLLDQEQENFMSWLMAEQANSNVVITNTELTLQEESFAKREAERIQTPQPNQAVIGL